jgi:hypothetical protein
MIRNACVFEKKTSRACAYLVRAAVNKEKKEPSSCASVAAAERGLLASNAVGGHVLRIEGVFALPAVCIRDVLDFF